MDTCRFHRTDHANRSSLYHRNSQCSCYTLPCVPPPQVGHYGSGVEGKLSPALTCFQGPKRCRYLSQRQTCANRAQSSLKCFTCERHSFHVASCPFPNSRAKIDTKLNAWRANRGVTRASSLIHAANIDLLGFTTTSERTILCASDV